MADSDSFSEVSRTSWGSRIGQSLMGVLVGLLLVLAAIGLLFWNEKNSVETARALKEGLGVVVSIDPAVVIPANEGKLVHLSGLAATTETLTDTDFDVSAPALKLARKVEMLQWREDKKEEKQKELGGGEKTVTTYTYHTAWSETPIDSTRFRKPEGHANPAMPYRSREQLARPVTLGAFHLSPSLLSMLGGYEPLPASVPARLQGKAAPFDDGVYLGQDPAAPQLGDLRISFSQVRPQVVSLFAAQRGNSFAAFPTKAGKSLERIENGERSAAELFADAASENSMFTWILRGAGFVLMFIGFTLCFKPISVILDLLPFLGNVAEWGAGFFALLLSVSITLVTVAVAWLAFRPLLGGGLLLAAVALFFGLGRRRRVRA